MPSTKPHEIPWPISSFPGAHVEESAGRLWNVTAEQLGDPSEKSRTAPFLYAWHRQPGLTKHNVTPTGQTGYRGGLIVNTLSYEAWANNASTVDVSGTYASLGPFNGTKAVSIARNQATVPDVVGVDIDNGAYKLSGGGAPTAYTGAGAMPQPNSVTFQDGFLFFTIADGRIFATQVNSLTMNALTFTTVQAKSSVQLLRAISFGGLLHCFTTASCEVYQNPGNVTAPFFPFTRMVVLEFGLVQANAIAGFEDGFSNLIWVAQDFGVYWLEPGSLAPVKISPPDLDRLIAIEIRAGRLINAGCYAFAGKKFWTLSSSLWTYEFNLNTKKWNERVSLIPALAQYTRWRGIGGHPAFGKWLMGDAQGGDLLWIDETNFKENGTLQLCRMESGPLVNFPNRFRVPRADFNFVTGVGTPDTLDPKVAISWSNDNGNKWLNPLVRSLGRSGFSKTTRISVKNTGQTGPHGRRWRWDASDPVYISFMGATQSTDPKEY